MKTISVFLFVLISSSISSCTDEVIIIPEENSYQTLTPDKPLIIKEEDDINKYYFQSDQIILEDSIYKLNLTPADAKALDIPDDLYQKYIELTEQLNSRLWWKNTFLLYALFYVLSRLQAAESCYNSSSILFPLLLHRNAPV